MGDILSKPHEEYIVGAYFREESSGWAGIIEWAVRQDRGGRLHVGPEQPDPVSLGLLPKALERIHYTIVGALLGGGSLLLLGRLASGFHDAATGVRLVAWAGTDLYCGGQSVFLFATPMYRLLYTVRLPNSVQHPDPCDLEFVNLLPPEERIVALPVDLGYSCKRLPWQCREKRQTHLTLVRGGHSTKYLRCG